MSRTSILLAFVLAMLAGCNTDGTPVTASPAVVTVTPSPSQAQSVTARGPLRGSEASSCVEIYRPKAITRRAFAFDGTVSDIEAGTSNKPGMGQLNTAAVTFTVNEWWRGGEGPSVTVDMWSPTAGSGADADSPAAYRVGTRLLVSGQPRWGGGALDDPIAWGCGFTRYYDADTTTDWRNATG